eukprot:jgi/Ulvmu1/10621/UM065_0078.1
MLARALRQRSPLFNLPAPGTTADNAAGDTFSSPAPTRAPAVAGTRVPAQPPSDASLHPATSTPAPPPHSWCPRDRAAANLCEVHCVDAFHVAAADMT